MEKLTEQEQEPHEALSAGWLYISEKCPTKLDGFTQFVWQQEKQVLGAMGNYRAKRALYSQYMLNDFTARVDDAEDNIFNKSNATLGTIRGQITFKAARTKGDLFGSKPWFSASPEGPHDAALAEKIYHHLEWKLTCADAQTQMEGMIDTAYNLGEAIARIGWRRDVDRCTQKKIVAVRKEKGKTVPVLSDAGDYLTDQSEMLRVDESGQPMPDEPTVDEAGNPVEAPAMDEGRAVFADAPGVEYPSESGATTWARWLVEEEYIRYNGLDLKRVDYTAFRCSPGYNNVAEAPFRGHVWEIRRSELRERLLQIYGEQTAWPAEIVNLWDLSKTAPTGDKTDETMKNPRPIGDEYNPTLRVLDAEVLWAATDDGDARWFYVSMLLDYSQAAPIYVDFLANELPQGHRLHRSLYSTIGIDELQGTWAGRGEWEKFDDDNRTMDRMWNEILVRNSMTANPMTAVNWRAIDTPREEVQWRPGAKVSIRENSTVDDAFKFVVMPDTNNDARNLLDFKMNVNMLETGVTSAAKGGIGDLPGTNTATGIQSVLASGSTLHTAPSNDMRRGFEVLLTNAACVLYTHQDTNEAFTYGDGEDQITASLNTADVRDIAMNIRLLMTRAHNTEIVERARTAIGVHTQYLQVPETEKGAARPLYVSLMKGLEIPDAERVIREPLEQDPNAEAAPNPMESIKVGYVDLPHSAKAQLLAMMGFKDITPEMIAEEEDEKEPDEKPAPKALAA